MAATGAAFLRPLHRTLAFIASGAVLFGYYFWIVDWNIVAQVCWASVWVCGWVGG